VGSYLSPEIAAGIIQEAGEPRALFEHTTPTFKASNPEGCRQSMRARHIATYEVEERG
jgi:hypothetical protein